MISNLCFVSLQFWLNCLAFWKALQEYGDSFYADVLNPAGLSKKARVSAQNIGSNVLAIQTRPLRFTGQFTPTISDPHALNLTKPAFFQFMYANFVVTASAQDLGVSPAVQSQVCKQLEPAYEELFDTVEEHVLHCLLEPWSLCLKQERERFSQVR